MPVSHSVSHRDAQDMCVCKFECFWSLTISCTGTAVGREPTICSSTEAHIRWALHAREVSGQ
jgi:hypothetical protein